MKLTIKLFNYDIIENLNNLSDNIDSVRTKLSANIVNKGVAVDSTATLDAMADKVNDIQTSGTSNLTELTVHENGTYTPSGDVDGYLTQNKEVTIQQRILSKKNLINK